MPYLPANTLVKPIEVFPVQMDVDNTPGEPNVYDLPPGKTSTHVRVHDADRRTLPRRRRTPARLRHRPAPRGRGDRQGALPRRPRRATALGHMLAVGRKYYPVLGLRMQAGHQYRVVGSYDAPTKDTIMNGAMAIMAGVFAPSDPQTVAGRELRRSRRRTPTSSRCRAVRR